MLAYEPACRILTMPVSSATAPVELAKWASTTPDAEVATTEPSTSHSELSSRDCVPATPTDLLKKRLTENDSKRSKALLK